MISITHGDPGELYILDVIELGIFKLEAIELGEFSLELDKFH